jgi:hypothetical protein
MTRILVIATYPIKNPQHGGQKRTAAIVDIYKQNFTSVKFVSVFFKGFYRDHSKTDIALGRAAQEKVRSAPLTGDIVCGEAIYDDPSVKSRMSALLRSYKPTIIHLEQPFTYLGLKPLLDELGLKPKIVFGSQNIESPMKEEMLAQAGYDNQYIEEVVSKIKRLEEELSQTSDLVVACTPSDMLEHQRMGARNCTVAPNGVASPEISQKDMYYWRKTFNKGGIEKFFLFVGSAHPPNWVGFLDMVSKGLGFIPLSARVVLAGSICDYFESNIKVDNIDIQDATFWRRAYSAGRLSEPRLVGLLNVSDVILLPITEGGGSNLKTAEAIITNKKVVATSHALRSFEWFKDFPNVWVADTQEEFQKKMIEAINSDFIERNAEQEKLARSVLWESCLDDLVCKVQNL